MGRINIKNTIPGNIIGILLKTKLKEKNLGSGSTIKLTADSSTEMMEERRLWNYISKCAGK